MTKSNPPLDIMLDLETMSTKPNAAIVSIGAVVMNFKKGSITPDVFHKVIDLESSVAAGLHMDPKTVMWWMKQSADNRKLLAGNSQEIEEVLIDFSCWLQHLKKNSQTEVRVWGNGAAFDNVILRNAYEECMLEAPWHYRGDMCYRTISALYPKVAREAIPGCEAHNALHDAQIQALHLLKIAEAGGWHED